jgi:hypothetical protein
MAHLLKHHYREAIAEFGRIVDPPSSICAFIAACHALLGEFDAASEQVAAYHRILKAKHNGHVSAEENAVQMRMDIGNFKEPEDQPSRSKDFVGRAYRYSSAERAHRRFWHFCDLW